MTKQTEIDRLNKLLDWCSPRLAKSEHTVALGKYRKGGDKKQTSVSVPLPGLDALDDWYLEALLVLYIKDDGENTKEQPHQD